MPRPRILDELHRDHQRFGRILTALDAWTAQGEQYDPQAIDRVGAMVEYLNEYPETMHHPLEDRVFELLLVRSLSNEDRAAVIENAAQHQALQTRTRQLVSRWESAISAEAWAPGMLIEDAKHYAQAQFQHMNFEEATIFPIAEREFSVEDWASIEAAERLTHDPLFDQKLTRFQSLYDFVIDDDQPFSSSLRQPTIDEAPDLNNPYLGARAFVETAGNWSRFLTRMRELQTQSSVGWRDDVKEARENFAKTDPVTAYADFCAKQAARQLDLAQAGYNAWCAAVERNAVIARRFLAFGAVPR